MTTPLNFAITVKSTDTETLVSAVGEIDAGVSGQLREQLTTAVSAGSPVIVDLSDVTFCDSSGLTTLIQAHTGAETVGTKLVIVTEQRALLRPIELLGLGDMLRIQPDIAAARAAIGSSGPA